MKGKELKVIDLEKKRLFGTAPETIFASHQQSIFH